MNASFARLAEEQLVWLPWRGIGFYPVRESPYDGAYFRKYQEYAETVMGRRILGARVGLVRKHLQPGETLLDVGIGCGAFVEAMGCRGFDVNPAGVVWLKDRRCWGDPREVPVDALTFWDSLEHIYEPEAMLANARRLVFLTLPIVPGDGPPPRDWKHLRRDEHVWYFTADGLIDWMAEQGFGCIEANNTESYLGREDVWTYVFERRKQPVALPQPDGHP